MRSLFIAFAKKKTKKTKKHCPCLEKLIIMLLGCPYKLTIDPVTMNELSKLNWALEISPLWPIRVCTRLKMNV